MKNGTVKSAALLARQPIIKRPSARYPPGAILNAPNNEIGYASPNSAQNASTARASSAFATQVHIASASNPINDQTKIPWSIRINSRSTDSGSVSRTSAGVFPPNKWLGLFSQWTAFASCPNVSSACARTRSGNADPSVVGEKTGLSEAGQSFRTVLTRPFCADLRTPVTRIFKNLFSL
jgi:hypothetical protein